MGMNTSKLINYSFWKIESLSWRHYSYLVYSKYHLQFEGTKLYEILTEHLGNPCKSGYGRWYIQTGQSAWIQEKDMGFLFMKYPFLIESQIS